MVNRICFQFTDLQYINLLEKLGCIGFHAGNVDLHIGHDWDMVRIPVIQL